MTDSGWSDERVELLVRLWGEGLSASKIAARLGGITRNAVIGKVHRLGLSGRAKGGTPQTPRPRTKPARSPAPRPAPRPVAHGNVAVAAAAHQPEPAPAPYVEAEDVVVPLSERVTIMDLRESMCRWPLGDPTTPEFRFCGARSVVGMPYCPHHSRIAYQPVLDRRRDRKLGFR